MGSVDKNFVNSLHLSFFSSILRFRAIYPFLFLFLFFSATSFKKNSFFRSRYSCTLHALSLSLHHQPRISFYYNHTYLFFFFIRISCIFFPSFSFFFCSCSCSIYFFFLVEIMCMHIPYYLHLCSVLNYDKARCSHAFPSGT